MLPFTTSDTSRSTISPFLLATGLVAFAVLTRVIPHPETPNVAGVAAAALFAGWLIRSRMLAIAVPIAAMLISDAIIGWDKPLVTLAVYTGMIAPVFFGRLIGDGSRLPRLFGGAALGSLAGSVLFFITTNLAAWATMVAYPKTVSGLAEAYTNGIPFFRMTAIGDLAFAMTLFGAWALVNRVAAVSRARELAAA